MKYKKLCTLLILGIGLAGIPQSHAQEGGYAGYFLDIGPGAQAYGLGTAITACYPHAEAIFWNPATLNFMERTEVALVFMPLWEGTSYTFLGYARSSLTNAFGIGYIHLSTGSMIQRDREGREIGRFSDVYRVLLLSLAWRLHEDIGVGFTIKGFNQSFAGDLSYGYGMDFGCSIRIHKGLYGGFNLRNLITRWGYPQRSEGINPRIRYGFLWRLFNDRVILAWELESYRSQIPQVFYGLEYRVYQQLALRTGYQSGRLTVGIELQIGDLRWNYAAIQHDLGSIRQFSLTHTFGKPLAYRRMEIEPNPKRPLSRKKGEKSSPAETKPGQEIEAKELNKAP